MSSYTEKYNMKKVDSSDFVDVMEVVNQHADTVEEQLANVEGNIPTRAALLNMFYPVGKVYESVNSTNPGTLIGGTWETFGAGRVLVGVDSADSDFATANKTGGAKTHTLITSEIPSHSHPQMVTSGSTGSASRNDYSADGKGLSYSQGVNTGATGGGGSHNNLQPYVTAYRWVRTA